MTDSTPLDLPLLRGMTSFYARYTPSSNKKRMTPDLQAHLDGHLQRHVTEADLDKAWKHCKRRVRDLRDSRGADASIRRRYDALVEERGMRRMTRQEKAAWEEEHAELIAGYKAIIDRRLSEPDKVKEALVVAYEQARERGEEALRNKKAATEEEKAERERRKEDRKRRRQARKETEKKEKEDGKIAAKEAKLAAQASVRQRDAQVHLQLKEARDKKNTELDNERKLQYDLTTDTLHLVRLLTTEVTEVREARAKAAGKENNPNFADRGA